MQIVGLTGSIAMGKSYAARMFRRFGVPVFDSDAAVHAMFGAGERLNARVAARFGDVRGEDGAIDRRKLGAKVLGDPAALLVLEQLVHPAVFQAQCDFLRTAARQRFARVVLDIPLLFEGGPTRRFDAVITVACSPALQRARALARRGMTAGKFAAILAKQLPVPEKLRRADRVIRSDFDRGHTHRAVAGTLAWLDTRPSRAWPGQWRRAEPEKG